MYLVDACSFVILRVAHRLIIPFLHFAFDTLFSPSAQLWLMNERTRKDTPTRTVWTMNRLKPRVVKSCSATLNNGAEDAGSESASTSVRASGCELYQLRVTVEKHNSPRIS
jgi:hypothetical protein